MALEKVQTHGKQLVEGVVLRPLGIVERASARS